MLKLLIKILQALDTSEEKKPVTREWTREGTHLSYEQRVWVQERLKALGLYPHKIYRDFVPGLIRAVEAFQASENIEVDGIVGTETWDRLVKAKAVKTQKVPDILAEALKYLGLAEVVGPKHNPKILEMFAAAGHSWVMNDETAWCAAFMNFILQAVGLKGTGKLNAKSFKDWGKEWTGNPVPGLVAVFHRGDPNSWTGHVAVTTGRTKPGFIEVVGGNQSNKVSKAWYPTSRLITLRVPA